MISNYYSVQLSNLRLVCNYRYYSFSAEICGRPGAAGAAAGGAGGDITVEASSEHSSLVGAS